PDSSLHNTGHAAATPRGEPNGQAVSPAWHDTGLDWPAHQELLCMDASHPHIFFYNEGGTGTIAYNWAQGTKTVISARLFAICGPRGLLYSPTEQGAWRFSLDDTSGRAIDHLPTHVSQDGSLQVYAFEGSNLWA